MSDAKPYRLSLKCREKNEGRLGNNIKISSEKLGLLAYHCKDQ